ncbi:MAG: type II toxin-antitoxin system VapC family toxin [Chthoniobacterales bacterium]
MIYFDTAYLAKCYLNEDGSDAVRKLAAESARVAFCAFGRIELAATLHRNLREGKITRVQSRVIWSQFDLDESNHIWTWLPVTAELLAGVTKKIRTMKTTTYLRAADALHLACASEHGFKEIYSNDRHLLAAAASFKIKGRNVIP